MALSPAERFALYLVGGERCIWCEQPITYSQMEVEHLIPKSLEGDEMAAALALHGLPTDYDLESLENLACSCDRCNGHKSARIPPTAPAITLMLDAGATRAEAIRRRASVSIARRDLDAAVARVEIFIQQVDQEPEVLTKLQELAAMLVHQRDQGGDPDERIEVGDHPALSLLWNRQRWAVSRILGPQVAVVTDGHATGLVGTHITYQCSNCGSYGPWNGVICLSCGNREFPD